MSYPPLDPRRTSPSRPDTGAASAELAALRTRVTQLEQALAEATTARQQTERVHQRREQRLTATLDNVPDVIARFSRNLHIIYINAAVEALIGIPAPAFLDATRPDLGTFNERFAQWQADVKRVFETGQASTTEFVLPAPQGRRWLQARHVPEYGPDGTIETVLSTARDMTERKQADARILHQFQQLAALHIIGQTILTSPDLPTTLAVVFEQVTARLRVDAVDVLVLDDATQYLEYAGGRGFRSSTVGGARGRLGEGAAGRALRDQQPIYVANLAGREAIFLLAPWLAEEAFVSYVALPLISNGRPRGVLELFHRAPLSLDAEWRQFAQMVAAQTAVALANAELFTDLQQANQELTRAYDATIAGWSHALDLRDKETEGHSQRVAAVTLQVARTLGSSEAEMVHVRRGALLHDIGKMGVPDHILLKPGPLTDEEWVVMRQHPVYAERLLGPITFLAPALDIPVCHHEKWDGSGYPRGLAGEGIPLAARIFAVVDVWDALRSDRPYRPAWPEAQVQAHLRGLAGSHLDPGVAQCFLELCERGALTDFGAGLLDHPGCPG